ncbi:ESCRT-I subunit protein SRN2 LALA0_S07e05050g [Lachancea lanzarotensis]|uniref:LALA0S07e05050g1_1 n=1 Tax=Lachancea lanzarotensis TaxID=1245769 RepID=A0A0C7N9I3_9SACH|nr:uncharacterized protein LALA0_S07e05050g [Lachancea lanzarotensis]CEP63215.1 LALA0S07e05050g1_1 [Lachancea lanzarotensis]
MEGPDLPPRLTGNSTNNIAEDDCEMPENINLVPAKVIAQLASEDREHLTDYVMRFESCQDVENSNSELEKKLNLLLEGFESTEERRERLQQKLSEVERLETEYESSWAKLNTLMATTYSDQALGLKMQKELGDLDSQAAALESNRDLEIDNFIAQYLKVRNRHHHKREILYCWQHS